MYLKQCYLCNLGEKKRDTIINNILGFFKFLLQLRVQRGFLGHINKKVKVLIKQINQN